MSIGEAFLKKLTTGQLLDAWELTSKTNDEDGYTVRCWLMKEFERRYPEAWNKWLEGEALDESLRVYILGGDKHE